MSCYIVDRSLIAFLVAAANHVHDFSWWSESAGIRKGVRRTDDSVKLGQILWDKNIESVCQRYPDSVGGDMPGPIGEDFIFTKEDVHAHLWDNHSEPIYIFRAISEYTYQSGGTEDWDASEARCICESLQKEYIRRLPGYSDSNEIPEILNPPKEFYQLVSTDESGKMHDLTYPADGNSREWFIQMIEECEYGEIEHCKHIGPSKNGRLRSELQGRPTFTHLVGPSWGGEKEYFGRMLPVIRYETPAANRQLSA